MPAQGPHFRHQPISEIVEAITFAVLGITVRSVALEGFLFRRLTWVERLIGFGAGFLLVFPTPLGYLAGLGLFGLLVLLQWFPWWRVEAA